MSLPLKAQIKLAFAIKNQNLDELQKFVHRVSNPEDNQMYGKYMSSHEVATLTAPASDSLTEVRKFLAQYLNEPACTTTPNQDFISCTTTVLVAENMVSTVNFLVPFLSPSLVVGDCMVNLVRHRVPHLRA